MTDDELMYLGAAAMLPHMLVATDSTDDWKKIEEQAFKALTLSACLLAWQRGAPKEVETTTNWSVSPRAETSKHGQN